MSKIPYLLAGLGLLLLGFTQAQADEPRQVYYTVDEIDASVENIIGRLIDNERPTFVFVVPPTGDVVTVTDDDIKDGVRAKINSSFTQLSTVCTDCPSACPPLARHVDATLQATAPEAFANASDCTYTNFTGVTFNESLNSFPVGNETTDWDFDGSVSACSTFIIACDMCDTPVLSETDPCP